MGLSDSLSRSAEDIIMEVLELEGRDALEAILILSSYLLNWAAWKLHREGLTDVAQEYSATAQLFERQFAVRFASTAVDGAQILQFPPRRPKGE